MSGARRNRSQLCYCEPEVRTPSKMVGRLYTGTRRPSGSSSWSTCTIPAAWSACVPALAELRVFAGPAVPGVAVSASVAFAPLLMDAFVFDSLRFVALALPSFVSDGFALADFSPEVGTSTAAGLARGIGCSAALDAPAGALSRSSGATGTDGGAVAACVADGAASTDITCTSEDADRGAGLSLATRSVACVRGPTATSTQPIPAPNAAAIGHQRRLRGATTYGDTRTGPSKEGNRRPINLTRFARGIWKSFVSER